VTAKKPLGTRNLKVRVKTAKKKTVSSQRWLQRQLNDPYVVRAKAEGWRSRAAYKLIEMNDAHGFLKTGMRVVDLGCAPGGWTQVAAQCVGREKGKGLVIGIDLLDVDPIAGAECITYDFTLDDAPDKLKAMLDGQADVVLSDMAANTTGHKKTDHLKIIGLAEMALEFAREILAPNGAFVAKVIQGGSENQLLTNMKRDFRMVKHVKPAASRADSAELYVLAMGYRGQGEQRQEEQRQADQEAHE
jgi:23S rRNA (uridine2552-2'-O)-methyltransferase